MLFMQLARSTLDNPYDSHMAVGTYQGVAGLAPRLFALEEETGSVYAVYAISSLDTG